MRYYFVDMVLSQRLKVWTAVYLFQVSKEIIKDVIYQKNILFVQLRKRTQKMLELRHGRV